MTEHDHEPIPGLPGLLPKDERILWQGAPDARALARGAFHMRLIAGYFALLAAVALIGGSMTGVAITATLGVVGLALLALLAWGSARTTIYTLTDRRIVMRIGIAVPKCVNLPLGQVARVGLAAHADGTGDLPLTLLGAPQIGWLALWPHARPWTLQRPQPMLRAVPDAANIATLIARTCLAADPGARVATIDTPAASQPVFAEAQAA